MTTLLDSPTRAQTLLAESTQHELRRLVVTETEETVILEGRVTRYYLKQLAQESLKAVSEGRRLINRVRVDD